MAGPKFAPKFSTLTDAELAEFRSMRPDFRWSFAGEVQDFRAVDTAPAPPAQYNPHTSGPKAEGANLRLAAAREALERRLEFGAFLAKLSPKDRLSAQRRVQVLEVEPEPARAAPLA